ncbi:Transcription factor [Paramicrosporidium saccamoebae]|uniref:Transcription factor n=1 Tax=Paramicrosporidium saccamoebae TaxID=1246581 RepID=A0A2H9THX6_9FUNG|nr:Transcription factor [Paramicrosporidium saccamoebae]
MSITLSGTPTNDAIARLAACLTKLQEQMERMAQMQSESTLMVSRLSGAVLRLSQEMADGKNRIAGLEERQKKRRKTDGLLIPSFGFDNPSLTPTINPTSLAADVNDILGPLVPRTARVLVVEDDVAYQWLVSKNLEAKGLNCTLAQTAEEALMFLQHASFDLILMDIYLPGGISGLDTARRIRAFDSVTPIVSMTSATTPRQIASYLAGGMNDVLPKPFSKDGLLGLVSRFCALDLGEKGKGPIEEIFSDDILDDVGTSSSSGRGSTFMFGPHL